MKRKGTQQLVSTVLLIPCMVLVFSQTAARAATLVLHLPFDDGAGSTTAADVSGSGHTGTLENMNPDNDWVSGQAGLALDFDGSNDHVSIADHVALDFATGDFSVSYWFFKRSATASFDNNYGVSKWSTGASPGINEWHLSVGTGLATGDNPSFAVEIGSTRYKVIAPLESPLHEWHHVAGVRAGTTISLYVDGVLVDGASSLPTGAAINNNGLDIRVAANQPIAPIYHTDALFDDLQIYDFALGDGDVTFLVANPGLTVTSFSDGFESGDTSAWSSTVQ